LFYLRRHLGGLKHLNVLRGESHCYFYDRQFRSVHELITHYHKFDIPNMEQIDKIRLLHPILYTPRRRSCSQPETTSPPPLPTASRPATSFEFSCTANNPSSKLYYSAVRDTQQSSVPHLIEHLRNTEDDTSNKCQCGLYLDEAELIRGWSVHISAGMTGDNAAGMVFFTHDKETSWRLPDDVYELLSPDQKDLIRRLKASHDSICLNRSG